MKISIFLLIILFTSSPVWAQSDSASEDPVATEATESPETDSATEETETPSADPATAGEPAEQAEASEPPAQNPEQLAADAEKQPEASPEGDEIERPLQENASFFRPVVKEVQIKLSKKKKKIRRSIVTITGKSMPGAQIDIAGKRVLIKRKKILRVKKKRLLIDPKKPGPLAITSPIGFFEFDLKLPAGTVNLPIKVTFPSGNTKKFAIRFKVRGDKVKTVGQNLAKSPSIKKKRSVWFGVGINYLSYDQKADNEFSLNFESFVPPAIFLQGSYQISNSWEVLASYNISPGSTSSSDDVQVGDGDYSWTIASLDAIWLPESMQKRSFSLFGSTFQSEYGLIFGYQYHQVPFLYRESGSTASIDTNEVSFGALGGIARFTPDHKWVYEIYMRYQVPLSSGDLFKVDSATAFDGSVGAYYKYSENLRLGGYWYGQAQTVTYSEASDSEAPVFAGQQSLLFSNFEFRIGYNW